MKSILFIGGDKRNLYLSKLYHKELRAYTYLLDNNDGDLKSCIDMSQYIVLPIPFSIDDLNVYSPLSAENLKIEELIKNLKGKTIICGGLKQSYVEIFEKNNNRIIDVMKYEELALNNAIPTAEGIIKIIIENTEITIDNSNIAIIGFGRVGKKVASMLNALNANIYAYDIKKDEVANIAFCGYNVLKDIGRSVAKMDVIINTVPQKIINEDCLKYINKETLIIDVSSKPGGVDLNYASKNGFNVIHALGIPGKIAPKTSAMYIKNVIDNILK
ncbi:MAG: hypothetical protein IKE01_06245 [Clostridia bacterium]|nr:hypothetical protein [Clostridia bacterium]